MSIRMTNLSFGILPFLLLLSPMVVFFPVSGSVATTTDRQVELEEYSSLPVLKRYGLLRLNVEPGEAETLVDGEYLDRNVWLISMRPGKHTLFVRKDGYREYRKNFDISDGDRLTFDIRLEEISKD